MKRARLASLLPCADLLIVEGGDHDLVETRAAVIAPVVDEHLAKTALSFTSPPAARSRLAN